MNVQGTLNFVNWIQNTSVRRVFFASSSEVYGFPKVFPTPETENLSIPDPQNPRFSYSSSKIIGEMIIINFGRSLGVDYQIGRFHNVYGPAMGFEHVMPEFIRKIVKNEPFEVQGNGQDSRCFCYVSDAVNAISIIMENKSIRNNIFNVGTPEETTIKQLIEILGDISGKKINPIFKEFEQHGTRRRVPDLSKINQLGFKPKINLKEGLKETYQWYKNYYETN